MAWKNHCCSFNISVWSFFCFYAVIAGRWMSEFKKWNDDSSSFERCLLPYLFFLFRPSIHILGFLSFYPQPFSIRAIRILVSHPRVESFQFTAAVRFGQRGVYVLCLADCVRVCMCVLLRRSVGQKPSEQDESFIEQRCLAVCTQTSAAECQQWSLSTYGFGCR